MINFSKYPLQDIDSKGAFDLVAYCQDQMASRGACELPEFVTKETLQALVAECSALETRAFWSNVHGNAYLDELDMSLPESHPRRYCEHTTLGVIPYDQIPLSSPLSQLYDSEVFMTFVARVLKLPKIFHYADPLGGLNYAVMKDSDYLRWHYDQTDFVSSLAIQTSEEGGDFEFVPNLRNAKDECYDEVSKVFAGDRSRVEFLKNTPGTLAIFMGRHSLHRVTPIRGRRPRYIALFGFDTKPGVMSSDHLRQMRYGRTKAQERRQTL